ncbi:hypothetical protein [Ovoidimarina sediminis]|uniref:hypothetical protein n=1 Tax=Ovoidimarina sediminis TaxID=3079856 RepID=UPI00290C2E3D|nr:hypothetical protein [Rhodophyticola sp. MJ-SS7]MDU8943967.1 hypothetical protein [Rhodophyticola sp. MJ-SS7]
MIPMKAALAGTLILATPAMASTQLERSVGLGLRQHGIHTDIETLDLETLARLSFALSNEDAGEGDVRTRHLLNAILDQADAKRKDTE